MDKNSADENWISYEKEDTASQNGNTEIADNTEKNRHPLWRTWWFWTAVGVLLLTAILLAVFLPKNKKQDARITQPAEISSQQQAVQNTETPQQIRQPTIPQENQPQSSGLPRQYKAASQGAASRGGKSGKGSGRASADNGAGTASEVNQPVLNDTLESREKPDREYFAEVAGRLVDSQVKIINAYGGYLAAQDPNYHGQRVQTNFYIASSDLDRDGTKEVYFLIESVDPKTHHYLQRSVGVAFRRLDPSRMLTIPASLQNGNDIMVSFPDKYHIAALHGMSGTGFSSKNARNFIYESFTLPKNSQSLKLYERIAADANGDFYDLKDGVKKPLSRKAALKKFSEYYGIFYNRNGKSSAVPMSLERSNSMISEDYTALARGLDQAMEQTVKNSPY